MANSTFPKDFRVAPRLGMGHMADAVRKGSLPWAWDGHSFLWQQRCTIVLNGAGTARIGATDLAAATSQNLDLHAAFPNNLFPANVDLVRGPYYKRLVIGAGGGVASLTGEVGDAGDTDELVTATTLLTLGTSPADRIRTSAAAKYDVHAEADFIPLLRLVADVNLSTLTALSLIVVIPFMPWPEDVAA